VHPIRHVKPSGQPGQLNTAMDGRKQHNIFFGPQISSPAVLRRNLVCVSLIRLSTFQQATSGLLNSTLALMPHRDIITGPLSARLYNERFVRKEQPTYRSTDSQTNKPQRQRPRFPTCNASTAKALGLKTTINCHKRTSSSKLLRQGSTALQLFYSVLSAR
jgi:hypothetical protein